MIQKRSMSSTHNEVTRISNHGSRTQSRAITLRSAPSTGEGSEVDFELWLSKSARAKTTARVVDLLQIGLSTDVLLNERLQRFIAGDELIYKRLEHKS